MNSIYKMVMEVIIMKIVVIKSPKLLSSFFRMIFKIKRENNDY
jgi:hypothetical protein